MELKNKDPVISLCVRGKVDEAQRQEYIGVEDEAVDLNHI
jgi:hypothetical protein